MTLWDAIQAARNAPEGLEHPTRKAPVSDEHDGFLTSAYKRFIIAPLQESVKTFPERRAQELRFIEEQEAKRQESSRESMETTKKIIQTVDQIKDDFRGFFAKFANPFMSDCEVKQPAAPAQQEQTVSPFSSLTL